MVNPSRKILLKADNLCSKTFLCNASTATDIFAICMRDSVPSYVFDGQKIIRTSLKRYLFVSWTCILAPPERHWTTTGRELSCPYSNALVSFSPYKIWVLNRALSSNPKVITKNYKETKKPLRNLRNHPWKRNHEWPKLLQRLNEVELAQLWHHKIEKFLKWHHLIDLGIPERQKKTATK